MTPSDEPRALSMNGAPSLTRRPYAPPDLEALGRWSALTLQQSVPIGPGGLIGDGLGWPSLDELRPADAGQDFLDRILDPRADGTFGP